MYFIGVNITEYLPFSMSNIMDLTELSSSISGRVTFAVIALLALHMGQPFISLRITLIETDSFTEIFAGLSSIEHC